MRSKNVWAVCALLASSVASLVGVAGCSRNNIEAVNLANDGDKARGSNLDEAISKYEQATQLDPTNHRILWKLALAYHKKEAWSDDALTCAKAQKVAPTFANYFWEQGFAIKQQAGSPKGGGASWADAKAPLEAAIKLDPGLSDAYEDLGDVLYHLDDEQTALQNYTKAIEVKPDQLSYYVALAQLYYDLGRLDQAEAVAREGLNFQSEGMNATPEGKLKAHGALFNLHSFLAGVAEMKGNVPTEITVFEAAKAACGTCTEPGQQIAYFNLGFAYSQATPPRKNEGIQQLQNFSKIICRGAGAARYADQCSQAQDIVKRLGGTLQ